MTEMQTCSGCGLLKPATREYFGGTDTIYGGLRKRYRACEKIAKRKYEATHKEERRKRDQRCAAAAEGSRRGFDVATKLALHKKQNGIFPCCFQPIVNAVEAEVDHTTRARASGQAVLVNKAVLAQLGKRRDKLAAEVKKIEATIASMERVAN